MRRYIQNEYETRVYQITRELIDDDNGYKDYLMEISSIGDEVASSDALEEFPHDEIENLKNHNNDNVRLSIVRLIDNVDDLINDKSPEVRRRFALVTKSPELLLDDKDRLVRKNAKDNYDFQEFTESSKRELKKREVEKRKAQP